MPGPRVFSGKGADMKPRVLKTHKILAAVLTVTCAPAAAAGAVLTAGAAQAAPARVSPPIDDDGYPLVGNLVRKGDGSPRPKPTPPPAPTPKPNPAPAPTPKPA
jgi:hypothetical protein